MIGCGRKPVNFTESYSKTQFDCEKKWIIWPATTTKWNGNYIVTTSTSMHGSRFAFGSDCCYIIAAMTIARNFFGLTESRCKLLSSACDTLNCIWNCICWSICHLVFELHAACATDSPLFGCTRLWCRWWWWWYPLCRRWRLPPRRCRLLSSSSLDESPSSFSPTGPSVGVATALVCFFALTNALLSAAVLRFSSEPFFVERRRLLLLLLLVVAVVRLLLFDLRPRRCV